MVNEPPARRKQLPVLRRAVSLSSETQVVRLRPMASRLLFRGSMRRTLQKCSLALLFASASVWSQTTAQQDAQQAGHDAKAAAKEAGSATAKTTKKAARKVKHGAKKTANKAAQETQKGANKVEQKTQ
ncbi:MAG TPA: hypothetical protein VH640_05590 [Bryobacteraceae bacterium]|jgi:hypothetical protein